MENKNKGGALYYFTLSMTAIYAIMGLYVLFSESIESLLPGNKKYIIGILLILYAFYRAYRIIRINKAMHSKE